MRCHVAGDQFTLVEASLATSGGTGGRPCDDVDVIVLAVLDDPVHHEAGEMASHLTPIAVLQPEHDVTGSPREGHGSMDAVWLGARHAPDERESTGGAHRCSRCVTSGTTSHEQHASIMMRGCDSHDVITVDADRRPIERVQRVQRVQRIQRIERIGQSGAVGTRRVARRVARRRDRYRARVHRFIPADRAFERIIRCVTGLALFGIGISLLIDADLGAAPWDVFHTGLSELTGLPVGAIIIAVGAALLLVWIPLGETPGLGTVLNAIEIGVVVDLVLPIIPEPDALLPRTLMMLVGIVTIAIASGFYIGAGLGPGPRDGLMTGVARRGLSIRAARTGIEVAVLAVGVALGGSIGIGTAVFALAIGPLVQVFIPRLAIGRRPITPPSLDADTCLVPDV